MSSVLEQLKEKWERFKQLNEEKKKESEKSFIKRYYSDYTRSARADNMTIIVDEAGTMGYYISRGSHDAFTYAAGYISNLRGATITEENLQDLMKYGCVIAEAYPAMLNNTNIYIPENITEQQQAFIANFEQQVQEYNEKNDALKIRVNKVVGTKELEDESSKTL